MGEEAIARPEKVLGIGRADFRVFAREFDRAGVLKVLVEGVLSEMVIEEFLDSVRLVRHRLAEPAPRQ